MFNKLNHLEQIDKFLEKHNKTRLTYKEIENLNPNMNIKPDQTCDQKPSNKQKPTVRWLHRWFLAKELIPIFLKLFQKIAEEGILANSLYEANITLT